MTAIDHAPIPSRQAYGLMCVYGLNTLDPKPNRTAALRVVVPKKAASAGTGPATPAASQYHPLNPASAA
jgi:hypothetical protein